MYIAPLEALAKERYADWSKRFGQGLGLNVVQLTGEAQADLKLLEKVRHWGAGGAACGRVAAAACRDAGDRRLLHRVAPPQQAPNAKRSQPAPAARHRHPRCFTPSVLSLPSPALPRATL